MILRRPRVSTRPPCGTPLGMINIMPGMRRICLSPSHSVLLEDRYKKEDEADDRDERAACDLAIFLE